MQEDCWLLSHVQSWKEASWYVRGRRKALKPDKMQTEDDEPKAGADDVLGADRVLRERKHPMQKFLEDAESSLNTPQPETPPLLISGPNRLGTAICSTQVPRDAREVVFKHACMCNAANSSLSQLVDKWNSKVFAVAATSPSCRQ